MKSQAASRKHLILTVLIELLIFALLLVVAWLVLSPKGRVSCSSFSSWEDALDAYVHGADWLDANHNGVPCESMLL